MTESLWEFASTRYARSGVAPCCLALQDELDADVNMLLAAAWLGSAGLHWQREQVEQVVAACAQWRSSCLLPLRAIRRDLRQMPGAENWYQRIKALELEAERHQLHRIEQTLAPLLQGTGDVATSTTEENLHIYLSTLPAARERARTEATRLAQLLMVAAAPA